MEKLIAVIGIFLWSGMAHAQVSWVNDLRVAQALSISQGKLIVMDFWAVWCGPCKIMDRDLWQHPDMAVLSTHFIPLKIDVDVNSVLARDFGANAIPKVIIMDAAANVLWEMTGYRTSDDYWEVLKNLPTDVSALNKHLLPFIQHKDQTDDHYRLASAYQLLGRQTKYRSLQNAFPEVSSSYFKKVAKKSEDGMMREKSELHIILNEAYAGNPNRALKQAEKLDPLKNEAAVDLKKFIQAYCYQCEGQSEKAAQLKKEIKSKEYLAELEDL